LIGGSYTIDCDATMGLGVRLRNNLKNSGSVTIVATRNSPLGIFVFGNNPAKKLHSLTTGSNR